MFLCPVHSLSLILSETQCVFIRKLDDYLIVVFLFSLDVVLNRNEMRGIQSPKENSLTKLEI